MAFNRKEKPLSLEKQKAIELSQIEFFYPKGKSSRQTLSQRVLKGIDLEVNKGEFCCLVGPNGSGKSTIIQLIAKVHNPTAGVIRIFGHDLQDWNRKQLAQHVAVVPQHFQIAFPYTVEEVVLLGRAPHRSPLSLDRQEDLDIAHAVMQITQVEHLAHRNINELSGGELKRVVVAKALAQEPKLLLLDEAGSHLDIRHQVRLYDLIQNARQKSGLTVLAAVHDLNLAAAYCEKFALLKSGQFLETGSLEQVMTYQNLRRVFDIDIYVGINELTGHRLFTPMAHKVAGETS